MNRNRMVFAVIVLLIIGACLPSNLIPIANVQPTLHVLALTQASLQTILTQTSALPPTSTLVPVTDTAAPATASPLPSPTETATASLVPDLTMTVPTATDFAGSPSAATATLVVVGLGKNTATPGVLTYGIFPSEVPFSQVNFVNRSKRQAYISLQVTTVEGGLTILEYPVYGLIKVKAPIGYYLYVAWVGGNKMVGNFRLHRNEEITIILYKDRVELK